MHLRNLNKKLQADRKTSRVTRGGPRRRSTTEQASRHWAVYPASMLAITPDGGDWAYRGPESGASVQAGYTQPSQSYHDKYGSAAHYQTESMGAVCWDNMKPITQAEKNSKCSLLSSENQPDRPSPKVAPVLRGDDLYAKTRINRNPYLLLCSASLSRSESHCRAYPYAGVNLEPRHRFITSVLSNTSGSWARRLCVDGVLGYWTRRRSSKGSGLRRLMSSLSASDSGTVERPATRSAT
ncbi:hypothetical protein BDZ97DRAFT_1772192 [Flammula alnicola]|nr:hypothetical protein BDZ97DRAFT_1772192 [Flammula alnicola]